MLPNRKFGPQDLIPPRFDSALFTRYKVGWTPVELLRPDPIHAVNNANVAAQSKIIFTDPSNKHDGKLKLPGHICVMRSQFSFVSQSVFSGDPYRQAITSIGH